MTILRYAIIENGIVVNCEIHDDATPPSNGVQSDTAGIGDTYDGTTFTPKPIPPLDPAIVEQYRVSNIKKQLDDIDTKSVRSLRSIFALIATGKTPDPADVTYISNLKAQADALRATL